MIAAGVDRIVMINTRAYVSPRESGEQAYAIFLVDAWQYRSWGY